MLGTGIDASGLYRIVPCSTIENSLVAFVRLQEAVVSIEQRRAGRRVVASTLCFPKGWLRDKWASFSRSKRELVQPILQFILQETAGRNEK